LERVRQEDYSVFVQDTIPRTEEEQKRAGGNMIRRIFGYDDRTKSKERKILRKLIRRGYAYDEDSARQVADSLIDKQITEREDPNWRDTITIKKGKNSKAEPGYILRARTEKRKF
jgi:hypothetical protein